MDADTPQHSSTHHPPVLCWKENDVPRLGIYIPVTSGKYARTLLTGIDRSFFCVHPGGTTEKWQFNNVADRGGDLYLYGIWKNVVSLKDYARTFTRTYPPSLLNSPEAADIFLRILSGTMQTMEYIMKLHSEHEKDHFPVYHLAEYILLGRQNEIYLPSYSLFKVLKTLSPPTVIQDYLPGAKKEPLTASLLILARIMCTGGKEIKEIDDILRPLLLDFRQMPPALSAVLDIAGYTSLPKHASLLKSLAEVLKPDTQKPKNSSFALQEKLYRKRQRNTYKKKSLQRILYLSAAGLLVILALILNTTTNDPFPIISPLETVQNFYTSINNLEHAKMVRLTKKRAGSELINEVSRVFVSSRMQLAIEGRIAIVSPDKYEKQERVLVFGISDLRLEIKEEESTKIRILASYNKWVPDIRSTEPPVVVHSSSPVRQILTLELFRDKRWYIVKIEELMYETRDE